MHAWSAQIGSISIVRTRAVCLGRSARVGLRKVPCHQCLDCFTIASKVRLNFMFNVKRNDICTTSAIVSIEGAFELHVQLHCEAQHPSVRREPSINLTSKTACAFTTRPMIADPLPPEAERTRGAPTKFQPRAIDQPIARRTSSRRELAANRPRASPQCFPQTFRRASPHVF